jgi:hypothetical protein
MPSTEGGVRKDGKVKINNCLHYNTNIIKNHKLHLMKHAESHELARKLTRGHTQE